VKPVVEVAKVTDPTAPDAAESVSLNVELPAALTVPDVGEP
jgi:hypothetical protein